MEASPLISVIIPTYNRYPLLLEALESIRRQTYTHVELIVVDDGSTDSTPELAGHPGMRYLRIDHCGKPGRVRNEGALVSSGRLLAFLDSDDFWKPEKLEKQVRFLKEHPREPLCHTREIWLRNGRIVSQSGQTHSRWGNIFEDCLKKCIIGPSTVLLDRELFFSIGMFNPDLEIAEDYELWLRICGENPVGYLDEALTVKRGGHEDQLSVKYGHIEYFRIVALLGVIEKGLISGENLTLARKELARKCRIHAQGCLKRRKEAEAARYFALSLRFRT